MDGKILSWQDAKDAKQEQEDRIWREIEETALIGIFEIHQTCLMLGLDEATPGVTTFPVPDNAVSRHNLTRAIAQRLSESLEPS